MREHGGATDLRRRRLATSAHLLVAAVTAFGVVAFTASVVALPSDFAGVPRESWPWIVPAISAALLTYLSTGLGLMTVAPVTVRVGTTWLVMVGESFTTMATPGGMGSVAVSVDYLRRAGADTASAATTTALASLARGLTELVVLPVLLAFSVSTVTSTSRGPGAGDRMLWVVLGVVLVAAGSLAIVAWVPRLRRRLGPPVHAVVSNLRTLVRHPVVLVRALLWQCSWITLQVAVLSCTLHLVGASAPVVALGALVILAFFAQRSVPLPGALGAPEALLMSGLVGAGVPAAPAVAAVASYRMLVYWLPALPGGILLRGLRHRGTI